MFVLRREKSEEYLRWIFSFFAAEPKNLSELVFFFFFFPLQNQANKKANSLEKFIFLVELSFLSLFYDLHSFNGFASYEWVFRLCNEMGEKW